MKKTFIVWLFIAIILFGGLTLYGFLKQSRFGDYYDLEAGLASAAKTYYEQYPNYLPAKSTSITSQKLIEENFLDKLELSKVNSESETCTGYVLITKQIVTYEYEAFIKCPDYITKKYDLNYEE